MLADGRLHLSGIAKLAPHLTESNRDEVLARAAHKSKRQIEELIAELTPRPDVPTVVRKLPARRSPAPGPPAVPSTPRSPLSNSVRTEFRLGEHWFHLEDRVGNSPRCGTAPLQ